MSTEKRFLTKADILGQQDIVTEDLFVPEWDAWVKVKVMTAAERDHFEASSVQREGKKISMNLQGIRARLCILCLVDEDGNRMFTDEDEYALGTKAGPAVDRIFTVAQRINGLRDEDVNALAKNSEGAPAEDLPSD
jgi:hypothetical protein